MKKGLAAFLLFLMLVPSAFAEADPAKLDQILEKQEQILKELAAIREELQVVKIRSTR
ncbi:MAG: hypothetical protein ACREH5_05155 [Candidatus Omnitrophota bacterium]